jgi:hypothetical protein
MPSHVDGIRQGTGRIMSKVRRFGYTAPHKVLVACMQMHEMDWSMIDSHRRDSL